MGSPSFGLYLVKFRGYQPMRMAELATEEAHEDSGMKLAPNRLGSSAFLRGTWCKLLSQCEVESMRYINDGHACPAWGPGPLIGYSQSRLLLLDQSKVINL